MNTPDQPPAPSENRVPWERMAEAILRAFPDSQMSWSLEGVEWRVPYRKDDDDRIIVLLTKDALEIRFPRVDMTGPYKWVHSSSSWRRVALDELADANPIPLLKEAVRARSKQFTRCRVCGQRFAPEAMRGKACEGCSTKNEHTIY